MSKISLIILGLVLLVGLTAAAREEEMSSLREVREAAPEAARDRKNGAGRMKKKGKAGRRKKNTSRGGSKKKNTSRGSKKKNTSRGSKKKNTSRGSKKKNTSRGSKMKNTGGRRKTDATRGQKRQSGTISEACFDQSITIMKMWKDVIANFDKQRKRMEKQNETAGKKEAKKSQFGPVGQMLVEVGGGNKSALSCDGSTDNDGAKQLKNLTDTLDACKDNVGAACDPANIPQPNMTFIMLCKDIVTQFKDGAEECLGKTLGVNKTDPTDACNCWTNPELDAIVQLAKKCKASDEAKAIAAALKNCTAAFSKCRKYEDDANTAISACTSDSSKLKQKAATLITNSASVTAALDKVAALAITNSSRRLTRAASTCAAVITYAKMLAQMAEDFPASPEISTTAAKIIGANVTCTAAEQGELVSVEASLGEAVAIVETALEAVQEQLMTLTGSTLASASAAAASTAAAPATVSTTAPSGRRIRNFNIV